jgi:O-methyltransferase
VRVRGVHRWFAAKKTTAQYRRLWKKFSEFTMIPTSGYISTLVLAEQSKTIQGCVVECGVWKGGMAAGLVAVLGTDREYFLLDSFKGLPPVKEIDGPAAMRWQSATHAPTYFNNCAAPAEFADQAMKLAGANRYRLVKGWFDDTLSAFDCNQPIAFLHLDADWYDSTMACLRRFFDQVSEGGVIVLDDYYVWDGCSRALHDFLSSRSAVERISSLGNVCYLKKAKSPADR